MDPLDARQPRAYPSSMRRPFGIRAVVVLEIFLAVTLLPGFAERFTGLSPIAGWSLDELTSGVFIGWALINVLAAIWLWTLSRRGWALTMILLGIGLIGSLVLWWTGQPHFVRMALQAATALYLNSAPVRRLFERSTEIETIVLRERADT